MIKQPISSIKMKEEYRIETDPVYAWFKECLELVPENDANNKSLDYFYAEFILWAENNGYKNPSKNPFSKRLLRIVKEASAGRVKESKIYRDNRDSLCRGYDCLYLTKRQGFL